MNIKKLNEGGNCYETALMFVLENTDKKYYVCHGRVGDFDSKEGYILPHGHAWVEYSEKQKFSDGFEVELEFCIDKSNGNDVTFPKEVYYHYGNIQDVDIYTSEKARNLALKIGTYGPWTEDEINSEIFSFEEFIDKETGKEFDLDILYMFIEHDTPKGRVNDPLWGVSCEYIIVNEKRIEEVIGREVTEFDREYIISKIKEYS